MAKDVEYEALISKYRILVARTKDLQEQLTQKQEQLDKIQAENKITDDATRSLCETILAKDRKEMTLGEKSSTWRSSSTRQLIKKAEMSFEEYVSNWTDKMKEIAASLESAHDDYESLLSQMRREKYDCGEEVPTREEIEQQVKADQEQKKMEVKMSEQEKKAQQSGIETVLDDGTIAPEYGEMIEEANNIKRDVQSSKLTSKTITRADSPERKKQKEQIQVKSVKMHAVNIADYAARMNQPYYWDILEAIGEAGISKYTEIQIYVHEKNPTITAQTIRNAHKEMLSMGLIDHIQISMPSVSKTYVDKLTYAGEETFKYHFEKVPCECELQKVIRYHDNPEHGYGILETARILEEKGIYDSVSCFNDPIKLNENQNRNHSYVPDIKVTKGKGTFYYEYERGLHTQEDFNDKCDKMLSLNRYLNFVVPNIPDINDKMIGKINNWIKTKPKDALKNVRIRLTTPQILKAGDMDNYTGWVVVYEFSKGHIRYSEEKKVPIEFKDSE